MKRFKHIKVIFKRDSLLSISDSFLDKEIEKEFDYPLTKQVIDYLGDHGWEMCGWQTEKEVEY